MKDLSEETRSKITEVLWGDGGTFDQISKIINEAALANIKEVPEAALLALADKDKESK